MKTSLADDYVGWYSSKFVIGWLRHSSSNTARCTELFNKNYIIVIVHCRTNRFKMEFKLASASSKSFNPKLNLMTLNKGQPLLVMKNYVYKCNKKTTKKKYWTCTASGCSTRKLPNRRTSRSLHKPKFCIRLNFLDYAKQSNSCYLD